jgi:hypothetical protein
VAGFVTGFSNGFVASISSTNSISPNPRTSSIYGFCGRGFVTGFANGFAAGLAGFFSASFSLD